MNDIKNEQLIYEQNEFRQRNALLEKVERSEKLYRDIVENTLEGMVVFVPGQPMIFANRRMTEITGYPQDEVYSSNFNFMNLWKKKDQRLIRENTEKRLAGKIVSPYEIELITKSGELKFVEINNIKTEYEGKPAIQVQLLDITERRQAEEALINEATRRRILQDQSKDGIVVLDQNGKVVESNQRFAEMLGYPNDEMTQLTVFDWEYLFSPQQTLKMIRHVNEKGVHFETKHRRKDGVTYDVELSTNAATFGGQKLIFCVCRDITDRKRAEEALSRSEENFRNSFDISPLPILINKGRGEIIYANQAMLNLCGYKDLNELKNTHITDRHPAEYVDVIQERWRKWELGEEVDNLEGQTTFIFRADGEIRHVEIISHSIVWDGEPVNQVIYRDITDRWLGEKALRESEKKYRELADCIPQMILETDEKGNYTIANRQSFIMTGYTQDDLERGVNFTQLLVPDDRERAKENFQRLLNGEETGGTEYTVLRKDGTTFPVIAYSTAIIRDGERVGLRAVVIDITERKQAENEKELSLKIQQLLNRSEEQRELIRELLSLIKEFSDCEAVGIRLKEEEDFPYYETKGFNNEHLYYENSLCAVDEKGEKVRDSDGNPILECMCGNIILNRFDPEKPFFTEGGSFWTNCTTDLLASTNEQDRLARTRNRCNEAGYESVALIPIKAEGINVGLLQLNDSQRNRFTPELISFYEGIASNIGIIIAKNQAETALQASEEQYRLVVENANQGIIVAQEKTIKFCNPKALEILGHSFSELSSRSFGELIHPGDREFATVLHQKRLKGEEIPTHIQFRIMQNNDTIRWINANAVIIEWEGQPTTLGFISDITERKQMEEQLRHSQVLTSLGKMTASIAHEVGNPLASIILYSEEALKGDWIPIQTKKDLKVIRNEAKRAGTLMKDLLAYSRKLEPKRLRVNVHSVVNKVLKLLQYQLNVQNIEITADLLQETLYTNGDASQLVQVFMNLILNAEEAVKDQGGGRITISSSVEGDRIIVSIADDGPGILEENLDQIFMPFYTTKNVGEGTGLGLSTCYGIVTAHDGLISAKNNESGGATFTVQLPLLGNAKRKALPKKVNARKLS
ncbi:MAG: PAS domain S-box protein [Dehalococcoidales bacterium]|nr:MAG: PAS domain S-box protein [Dehalococcoidales bacterium]